MKINAKVIINEIMKGYNYLETTEMEVIKYRYDVLGYLDIIDKKYAGYCFVSDLNSEYSPKLKLYALANGNEIPVKIDKKTFKKQPLKRGDIIVVKNQAKRPKQKRINGHWVKIEGTEWWVTDYQIC